jgi:hypothetical protein
MISGGENETGNVLNSHFLVLRNTQYACEVSLYRSNDMYSVCVIQGPAEMPDDLVTRLVVSGTVGVRNLSLSALQARLKAFQMPWSAGL